MRWRRNQPDTGNREAYLRDVGGDLVPGELPPLARLRALGHLDLELISVDQIFRGDAEAARGDLLDLRAQ